MSQLFIEERGQEHHQTIIFLHATGASGHMWHHHLAVLERYFHCLAIDLPGHGRSREIEWTNFEDITENIVDIINKKSHGKPHLVGLSLGGSLILKLLESHSHLVDKVIIDGASHQPIKGYRIMVIMVGLMSLLKNTAFIEKLLTKMMEKDGVSSQEIQSFLADMRAASSKFFRRAMTQANLLRAKPIFQSPALFLSGGKESPSIHASHQTLAKENPDSECAYYPDKGHAWLFSDAPTHIEAVQYFLQGKTFPEKLKGF
ncbi:S33 family peptidase [Streptococcus gallolyticus]|uniref:S33 family peptidase n=1 Tax=Streptococcus gallolyticus TaxID=315405 RepID=A0AA94M0J7_9STRE|nr:alpha/beta fold hydrolase [Streptococcus gallolyticus]AQP41297.1 hypothetical protein BTR42_01490 [Streptococcus gallolyticus subsp. gallolyticus DSM 16831]SQG78577.1 S33 family peptidase [Streptococcus gallolyticus]